MKWPKVRLGDIGRVAMCKRVLKEFTASTGDIPFYKIGTFGGKADAYISTDLYETFKAKYSYPTKGNVLISAAGTIGKVVVFDGAPSYFQDSNIVWLEHDGKSLLDSYLYYFLLRHEWQITQGATIQRLYNDDIRNTEINLPPLPIQQKIADILGAYDDLIENNRRRIELLEKMARELYRERFVRRREGVFETRTLEQIGVRLESGSRPKGGVKDLDEGIPSVGAENVIGLGKYNYGSEKLISEDFYTKMRRGKIQDRDILLYKDGAYIGRVSLFQDGFPHKVAAVNEHVFLLHAEDEVIQYFLFFTLAQDKYFKIMQGLNENAAQPGLNQGSVYGLKIDLPDFEQIKQFNDIVSPLVSEIFSLSNQNRNLAKQRDRLLPRLMSGKLDVSKLVKEGV